MTIDSRSKYPTPKQLDADRIKKQLAKQAERDERRAFLAPVKQKPNSVKKRRLKTNLPSKLPQSVSASSVKILKGELAKLDFYQSREWRELRFAVLRESDGCCVYCGRSRAKHGIVIHIDHIKPRSKYPSLQLTKSNLQVTCEDCNLGKGATEL